MKRLLFLLIALLVVSSFGEETGPKPRRKNSFYFDATVGMALRHLEAEQTIHHNSVVDAGCHFEPDGRYVCGDKSSGSVHDPYEKDIGYTGFGPLLGMRFGCLIKGVFALFANFELERTTGKVYGREKNEDDAKPSSVFLGGGPGVAFYPFRHSSTEAKNIYIAGAANLLLGGGGGIGFLGVNVMFEAGYLYPLTERLNVGFAAGVDLISPGSIDEDINNEGGFAVWAGVKIVRK